MQVLKLSAKDFKDTNNYWKEYIGKEDVSDYKGHIEIEGQLGWVRFSSVVASGHIWAEAGTGIKAGWGIKAGEGIKAGTGIKAGEGIEAGWGIKAGRGIEAGEGIKAGWGIEAGEGIKAGLSITCKFALSFSYKLFAGICYWRNITDNEKTITCGRKEGTGVVEYGILKEVGMPDEPKKESLSGKTVKVEIDGQKYEAVIK